jgi:hypothetical protein
MFWGSVLFAGTLARVRAIGCVPIFFDLLSSSMLPSSLAHSHRSVPSRIDTYETVVKSKTVRSDGRYFLLSMRVPGLAHQCNPAKGRDTLAPNTLILPHGAGSLPLVRAFQQGFSIVLICLFCNEAAPPQ